LEQGKANKNSLNTSLGTDFKNYRRTP
jgi:hypothetical protein